MPVISHNLNLKAAWGTSRCSHTEGPPVLFILDLATSTLARTSTGQYSTRRKGDLAMRDSRPGPPGENQEISCIVGSNSEVLNLTLCQ
jgi:hypothetical protein